MNSKPPVFNFFGRLEQNRPFMAWVVLTIIRLGGLAVALAIMHLLWPTLPLYLSTTVSVIFSLSMVDAFRIAYPEVEKEPLWKRVALGAAIGLSMGLLFLYAASAYHNLRNVIG